jgi:alpha-amylase/alpha-mannosidase (GH57 family)
MFVTIHGHFYQPPRENPWTGTVPRQEGAHPAHDWNQRVADECYRPNARSRVMGAGNRIEEIVNNYAFLSFDFGPTLLSWLELHEPSVYRQILEGDRNSVRLQQGHGNGIAHVYNHMILPLANYRDKRTQIAWGLRDFEWRFSRKSESIWLAETAVNLETIRVLIDFGVRYVILSPYQAARVRPIERAVGWTDVRGGRIDPTQPYRFFLRDSRRRRVPDRSIDVFFYDGPIAADVSFGHLLRSAPDLADRLAQAGADLRGGHGLVSVATDGEVYGHHEPFGDMCISYLLRREGPRRGFRLGNYGHFLDRNPPEHEVDLEFGENDEGSAWSCSHGVGRWERDCGCSTGGQAGWNQKWRTPLRRGLDVVRDRLAETYLEQASPLLKDPWAARDDYVLVLLDRSPAARQAFLDQHARAPLGEAERRRVWAVLESQRYAMYMYTSCGWFFADISGIETVQNLAYAARAIELGRPWQRLDLEAMLLDYLADAASNLPEHGTGADVYRRFVRPQIVTPQIAAGDLAIAAAVMGGEPQPEGLRYEVVRHRLEREERATGPDATEVAHHAVLELRDRDLEDLHRFEVHAYHAHLADIRCYVLPVPPERTLDGPRCVPETHARQAVSATQGACRLTLTDLVAENRERILRTAFESILEGQEGALEQFYRESRDLMATFRSAGAPVPPVVRAVAAHVLARLLADLARRLRASFLEELGSTATVGGAPTQALLGEIGSLLHLAREGELEVPLDPLSEAFGAVIEMLLEKLLREPDPAWAQRCLDVIRSSYDLHFPLDRRRLEDLAFLVLRKHRALLLELARQTSPDGRRNREAFEALAEALHLNIRWILEMGEGNEAEARGT